MAGYNIIGVAVDPLAMANVSTVDGLSSDEVVYRDDLLDPLVGKFVLSLILSGRVIGSMGSPPCSTISAARHIPLSVRGGPRPLRSRFNPWEPLKYCSPRETAAVELGSVLFLLNLGILGEVRHFGGWTGLEHPAERGPPFPSFFITAEVAAYRDFTRSRYVETHQCMFGAASKKPTGLLLPWDCLTMARRCNHGRQHTQLRGLDDNGNFRTTAAAQYPHNFSLELARSCVNKLVIARQRSYTMPYMPFAQRDTTLPHDPWGLGLHVHWEWPQPSSAFLAEHIAACNHRKVHQGLGAPQQ